MEDRKTSDSECKTTLDSECKTTLDSECKTTLDSECKTTLDSECKTTLDSECKTTLDSECKITDVPSNDFHLLTEEKFDFDLSLSPTSENEDEVFVGPVGHKEKCIAVRLESHEESQNKIQSHTYDLSWSPAADNFVEIFKEAHLLAFQFKSGNKREKNNSIHLREEKTQVVEKFVKESKSKLKILEKGIVTDKRPTPARRETYCVRESPSSQLLPSIQKHLRQPVTIMDGPRSRVSLNTPSPAKTDKLSKMHSVSSPQTKNDTSLKKGSKFQTVKTSPALRNNSCLVAGETKQGKLPSSSNKIYSNSMGSSEDLLSDKSSVASDVGELSFSTSSSMQSKRILPTPSKLEMKTRQLKPNNVHMRRNTSSSSSSSISSMNSSLNSSLSISPKRGSVKMSAAKAAADISRRFSVPGKISIVKPMKGFSVNAAHSDASGKQPTPKCAKGNPVNIPKYKATLTSERTSSNMQKGSDSSLPKVLSKNTLGSASTSSSLKLNSKTAAPNLKQENKVSRVLQSNPVLSGSNIESNVAFSTPVKQLERTVLKSCSAVKPFVRTPDRRHSTLPISVGRCILGIPTLSPQTVARTMASPNSLALQHVSSGSSKKTTGISSKCVTKNKTWMSSSLSSAEGDLSPPKIIPIALAFSPDIKIEQDITKKGETAEVILAKEDLIEFETDKTPVAIQECENKPLIDLFNTPEITKASPLKSTVQLIDLSSPLMKLSPEGNKENSPLLKF